MAILCKFDLVALHTDAFLDNVHALITETGTVSDFPAVSKVTTQLPALLDARTVGQTQAGSKAVQTDPTYLQPDKAGIWSLRIFGEEFLPLFCLRCQREVRFRRTARRNIGFRTRIDSDKDSVVIACGLDTECDRLNNRLCVNERSPPTV